MNTAVNYAVKTDRRSDARSAKEDGFSTPPSIQTFAACAWFRPEQADRAQWFSKCPKCGQQIGIAICPVEVII